MFMLAFVFIYNLQLQGKILQATFLYLTIRLKGTFEMF
jgi:hypothetical protein